MKKTLLLIPPLTLEQRMGELAEGGAVMPGLGILYIASYLRKVGMPVSILDAEGKGMDIERTAEAISNYQPDILGITTTTVSIIPATEVAKRVKNKLPDIRIFFGGPHVTAVPMETMQSFKEIDGCILGDGEISFGQVVKNINEGVTPDSNVDGIIWRNGNGNVELKQKFGYLEDLDSLPFPAWDMLEGFPKRYRPPFHSYRKLPVANIITTRGCPYACSFCDRSVFGKKTYGHSIEYVIEMIEYLIKDFGIREVSIKDDMFIIPERVFAFCDLLGKKNIDIAWSCNARVNFIKDDLLREMKTAGCWMIAYGIESGSPEMLKKMMKGITKEQSIHALRLTRKHGIVSKGFFMVGIPGETVKTMQETLDFIKDLPLDEMNVNCFTPFPGTKLYNEAVAEGFKTDFRRMNMIDTVYVPKGLTENDLKKYQKKIIYSFYLKPAKMLLYLSRAFSDVNELKRLYRMAKMFIMLIFNKFLSLKIFHQREDKQ